MVNEERIYSDYHDMIKINSISGNEREIAEYIAARIEEMGLVTKWVYFEEEKKRPSVYTRLKGGRDGPTIMLIGHTDTVDILPGWDTDPFTPTVIGDKTYGRGSMDMKGGLAAILGTIEHLSQNPSLFKGEIIAAFVADEEVLSKGTYKLLEEELNIDMAIMAECRFDNVAIGFRGRYSIEVNISGEAAHSCEYPACGDNALISASKLAIEIESLSTLVHPKLGKGTWCVKYIEGGVKNTLVVPNRCKLILDRFFVEGENYDFIEKQIMDAAKKIGLQDKVKVKLVDREMPYMEPFCLSENDKLVTTLKEKYYRMTGKHLPHEYDLSVCDSNILVNSAKIPTVTFGPSGGNMHGANEYGYFDQVITSTKIYIETIKALLK